MKEGELVQWGNTMGPILRGLQRLIIFSRQIVERDDGQRSVGKRKKQFENIE